eukprot:4054307-Amphidinium_carterae.1
MLQRTYLHGVSVKVRSLWESVVSVASQWWRQGIFAYVINNRSQPSGPAKSPNIPFPALASVPIMHTAVVDHREFRTSSLSRASVSMSLQCQRGQNQDHTTFSQI